MYDPLAKNTTTAWWIDLHPINTQPASISTTKFFIVLFVADSIFQSYSLLKINRFNAYKHVIDHSFIQLNSA